MPHKQLFSLIFLIIFSLSTYAQTFRKYSNEFLKIGVDAQSLGLGNAHVANNMGVSAAYWNPANLSYIQKKSIGLMHAEYFGGIAGFDYVGFATPIDNTSALGVSIIRFSVDDIPDTTELIDANGNINYDKIKSISATDLAFLISYSRKLKALKNPDIQLSTGGSIKIVSRKAGPYANALGFGIDAAISMKYKKWNASLVGKDITTTFNAWTYNTENLEQVFQNTGNTIPENDIELTSPELIAAVGRKFQIREKYSIQPELNFIANFDGTRNQLWSYYASLAPVLGIEFGYKDLIFLRMGANNIYTDRDINNERIYNTQASAGLGIRIRNVSLDYALTNFSASNESFYSNVFSLKIALNSREQNNE
jgi:hypothetical protein